MVFHLVVMLQQAGHYAAYCLLPSAICCSSGCPCSDFNLILKHWRSSMMVMFCLIFKNLPVLSCKASIWFNSHVNADCTNVFNCTIWCPVVLGETSNQCFLMILNPTPCILVCDEPRLLHAMEILPPNKFHLATQPSPKKGKTCRKSYVWAQD